MAAATSAATMEEDPPSGSFSSVSILSGGGAVGGGAAAAPAIDALARKGLDAALGVIAEASGCDAEAQFLQCRARDRPL